MYAFCDLFTLLMYKIRVWQEGGAYAEYWHAVPACTINGVIWIRAAHPD